MINEDQATAALKASTSFKVVFDAAMDMKFVVVKY